ncbi:MAG: cytochrome c [Lysobacteraceae bacterium]|nr:MAG: cytochrome c [Xanthomonadaceae bacterium]
MKITFILFAVWSAGAVAGPVDFTPHGTQPGLFYPMTEPRNCSDCHSIDAFPVERGEEFSPQDTWRGSMMANAARDPLFWAALDVANNDMPGVGDYCLRCHSPVGWLNGRVSKDGFGGTVDGADGCELSGGLDELDDKSNDFAGVTCHLCHRVDPTGPADEPFIIGNANLWLNDDNCPDGDGFGPCRKGPYTYSDDQPPHKWAYSSLHESSELCGGCHEVSSPNTSAGIAVTLRDETGADTGLAMPNDRTYSEWKLSDFSEVVFSNTFQDTPDRVTQTLQCQGCHMPDSEDENAKACFGFPDFPDGFRQGNLPMHRFVGGNVWMTNIIKGQYGAALGREMQMENSAQWAEAMLQQAAELSIESVAYDSATGQGSLSVRVVNQSGHKLPSGYAEGRRMWIQVVVKDGNSDIVWQDGVFDEPTGDLATSGQTKIYEALQGRWNLLGTNSCDVVDGDGNKQFHLVLNNCIAKDNRIPPYGFRGGGNVEVAPVGYNYPTVPGQSDRLVHWDDTDYGFTIPAATVTPIEVEVSLNYQTSSKDYIEFLRNEAVDNAFPAENMMCNRSLTVGPGDSTRGQYMYDLWNNPAYGKSPPVIMATQSQQVPE